MTKRKLLKAIWRGKAIDIDCDTRAGLDRWYWRLWYCLKCAICVMLGRKDNSQTTETVWSIANWNHYIIQRWVGDCETCIALDVGYGIFTGWHYDAYELEY
jgi:hypothetical protein